MSDFDLLTLIDNNNTRNFSRESFDFHKPADHDEAVARVHDVIVESFAKRSVRKVPRNLRDEDIKYDLVDFTKIRVQMDGAALDYVKNEIQWTKQAYMPEGPHDHPVSHHMTEMNEQYVVQRFGKQPFVDVYGNPKRHHRYGRNYSAYTTLKTAKDYIRDFSGCPKTTTVDYKKVDYRSMARDHPKTKHFLMTHSAYYLTPDNLGDLLHEGELRGKRRVYAIVHRHPETSGFLNNGELEYAYISEDVVRQVSVSTGEGYTHKSMEPYFHQNSVETTAGPIAWTTSKLAGDSYLLEFVAAPGLIGAPAELGGLSSATCERTITISGTEHYKVLSFWGKSWLQYNGPQGTKMLADHELYDILRRYVAGRPRTQQTKKDLTLLCRRLVDKRDIFAKYQAEHDIAPEELVLYVEAAFHADIETEIDVMLSFRRSYHAKIDMHTSLLEDPSKYDDSWTSTLAASANVVHRVGSAIASHASKFVPSVVEATSDAMLSLAAVPFDVVAGSAIALKPGLTRESVRVAVQVSKQWSELAKRLLVDESCLREAVEVHMLTKHVLKNKQPRKFRSVPPIPNPSK